MSDIRVPVRQSGESHRVRSVGRRRRANAGRRRASARGLSVEPLEDRRLLTSVGNDTDWALSFGNNQELWTDHLAVAPGGDIIVAGRFTGTMDFAPRGGTANSTLSADPGTSNDGYVARYHSDGTLAWVTHAVKGPGYDRADGIAVDAIGNVFVSGSFRESAEVGGELVSTGQTSTVRFGYLIKYSSEGEKQWVKTWGVLNSGSVWRGVQPSDVAISSSGNIYVCGKMLGAGVFSPTVTTQSQYDDYAFLLKLDADGVAQGVWSAEGYSEAYQVTVDAQVDGGGTSHDLVTINGQFRSSLHTQSVGFAPNLRLTPVGQDDVFVAHFSADAATPTCTWVRQVAGTGFDAAGDLAVGDDGDLYVSGAFEGQADFAGQSVTSVGNLDTFVAKLRASDGNVLWAQSVGGLDMDDGLDEWHSTSRIATAGDNLFVLGEFRSTVMDVDSGPNFARLTRGGDCCDSYVMQLNVGDGAFRRVWHLRGEPASSDPVLGSLIDSGAIAFDDGFIHIAGCLRGTGQLPPGSLTSIGAEYPDVYVLRFGTTEQTPNSDPVAHDDAYVCQKTYSMTVPKWQGLLANDDNPDLDSLRATVVDGQGPTKGSVAVNPDGSFVYTPYPNIIGTDSFNYDVSDGRGGTSRGTVTIQIEDFQPITLASTDVPKSITDLSNRVTVSQLVVDPLQNFQIGDLNVAVSFTHPRAPDLDVYLVHPDGTRIELFTDIGGNKSAFTGKITTLDDEAKVSITKAAAPFEGSYMPEGKLSALKGKSIAGMWKLEIMDDQSKEAGKLNSWSLIVMPKNPYAPLMAAGAGASDTTAVLTQAQAEPLLNAALAQWQATGVNVAALAGLSVQIADLGGTTLGLAAGNTIWLDDDAAGWGWFVDATPHDDREFLPHARADAQQRIDLLTVVLHEMGHLLGREHAADGLMAETLATGARRSVTNDPHAAAVDHWFAQSLDLRAGGWLSDWLTEQLQPKRAWSRNRR